MTAPFIKSRYAQAGDSLTVGNTQFLITGIAGAPLDVSLLKIAAYPDPYLCRVLHERIRAGHSLTVVAL